MDIPVQELFGTDGVRGVVGADLTTETVRRLGAAFGTVLRAGSEAPEVLIGRDTRVSGPALADAVSAGLCGAGVDVVDCGIITTPGLCLHTRQLAKAGGVVVSASHNPPEFNGIKLVGATGDKLPDETEGQIEELIGADDERAMAASGRMGQTRQETGHGEAYLELLLSYLDDRHALTGLNLAVDCAWGAAYGLGPEVLRRAGANVVPIHAAPRGELINVECGALHPQQLAERVLAERADLGVAFDGDADRAMFVDECGHVRDGDFIKYILAVDMQERGALDPPVVVGTLMTNPGLEMALKKRGVELLRAPVGDRYVRCEMTRTGAKLGGEQSGHIVLDDLGIGDGLYTTLRLCQVVAQAGRPLSELSAPVSKVPQILRNVTVRDGYDCQASGRVPEAVREWEQRLGDSGYIVIRPSGTEPLLRIMVAAADADLTGQAVDALVTLILEEGGTG